MAHHKLSPESWIVLWFQRIDHTISIRSKRKDVDEKIATMKELGYLQIADPFRKGAPAWGYNSNERLKI